MAKGVAYLAEDGSVYFAIDRFRSTAGCRAWTRERSNPARACPRTTTRRRTRRTSRYGSGKGRRTRRPAPRGILPWGAADQGGTSSARRMCA